MQSSLDTVAHQQKTSDTHRSLTPHFWTKRNMWKTHERDRRIYNDDDNKPKQSHTHTQTTKTQQTKNSLETSTELNPFSWKKAPTRQQHNKQMTDNEVYTILIEHSAIN